MIENFFVILFIIILILGAIAGGESFGDTIAKGIGALLVLGLLATGYSWFKGENEKREMDESANYNLCVRNFTAKPQKVEIESRYIAKNGSIQGHYRHSPDLEAFDFTHLVAEKKGKMFGAIASVKVGDGKYTLNPDHYIKLTQDSQIKIQETGITVEPDAYCGN